MVKLTKREVFKLNKGLKIHRLINDIADGFNLSYQDGIAKTSTDINSRPFKKIKPITVELKRKRGNPYPSKPLYAEGKMKNTYVKKEASRTRRIAEISINARERGNVSIKHNEGIGVDKREWFGIGKVQKNKAQRVAQLHIKKALR